MTNGYQKYNINLKQKTMFKFFKRNNNNCITNAIDQTDAVIKHLEKFEKLTSFEAFEFYGCTRLSDKIYRLRKKGVNISTLETITTNRYGNRVNYATYKLIK